MKTPRDPAERAARIYAALLTLYPRAYRDRFGLPMRQTFADEHRDRIRRGEHIGAGFWLGVLADLMASGTREWIATARAGGRRAVALYGSGALLLGLLIHGAWFSLVGFGMIAAALLFVLLLIATRRLRWHHGIAVAAGVIVLVGATAAAGGQGATAKTGCAATHRAAPPPILATAAEYLAQGDAAFDRGDCAAAIAAYSQAITLAPQYAEAYNNRAYTYMMQDDYARALPDLDQAIALRPNYAHALMNRGDIYNYYYHIDRTKAVRDYDRVLAQGPTATQDTSVCGHRLLAMHNGWNLGTLVAIVIHGPIKAGCVD